MDWDAVDARLDAEAKRGQLRSALTALPERDRELLLLVAWEGLTPAEAAAVLGIGKVAARAGSTGPGGERSRRSAAAPPAGQQSK